MSKTKYATLIDRFKNMLAQEPDLTHPNANMYGVFRCPVCKSIYRWPNQKRQVICDDCGLVQNLPEP